jgi:hypothetical protein
MHQFMDETVLKTDESVRMAELKSKAENKDTVPAAW